MTPTNADILEAITLITEKVTDLTEKLNELSDNTAGEFASIKKTLVAIDLKLNDHAAQLSKLQHIAEQFLGSQSAYINDLKDILDHIHELEKRLPTLKEVEIRELEQLLRTVAEWALKAARSVAVPLRLPT